MRIRTPIVLDSDNVGDGWVKYIKAVLSSGNFVIDDREEIIEAGPISIFINYVNEVDKIIEQYGDKHVVEIYTQKMFSKDIIKELNSTYGDRIFDNNGVDQLKWITDRLKGKWWTKAAAISLLKPNDPGPRIPCLTQIQFLIRNDKIELHSIFRSQNVFRSYGNFIGLRAIQKIVAETLDVQIGPINSYCVSPHIYKSDIDEARMIVRDTIGFGH